MRTSEEMSEEQTSQEPAPTGCRVCGGKIFAKGLCGKHYQRQRRYGNIDLVKTENQGRTCSVEVDGEKCPRPAYATGLCTLHYERVRRNGEPGPIGRIEPAPLIERIRPRIDTSGGPHACHPWTGPSRKGSVPTAYAGTGKSTRRSVRRLLIEETGRALHSNEWVKMLPTCDPLCCNMAHMRVTTEPRPGTRGGA